MVQLNWYPQEGLVYCITKVIGGCIITMIVQAARGQNFQVAKSKFSSRAVAIGRRWGRRRLGTGIQNFQAEALVSGGWALGRIDRRSTGENFQAGGRTIGE